jgi:hypothetical protein
MAERAVDLSSLAKKLVVPPGFVVPARLEYEDLVAEALAREHLDDDVRGINESVDLIRRTRGGDWPAGPVTAEEDFADLVWHEVEFREGHSFTYAVYASGFGYIGCAYLYPLGRRTPLSEELLGCDADASWWVTADAYERGYYEKVHAALGHWIGARFPFGSVHYSNALLPGGR